jgi:hypothetical protein
MRRSLAALVVLALIPALAPALEIKNVRPSYGPLGAKRAETKFLPGDVLWINYDIDGLTFDAKTGKSSHETKLEFLDGKGEVLFERKTPNQTTAQLGGTSMPGDLHVILGLGLPAGKYTVKLTVTDILGKQSKSIVYPIQLLPSAFGFVAVTAPALGLPGQHHLTDFGLVGMALDPKTKLPLIEATFQVLDQNEKPVAREQKMNLPADLPAGVGAKDLSQVVQVQFPLFLNRTGQFYIDIVAIDKNAKDARVHMRFPLTVLDIGAITGGK